MQCIEQPFPISKLWVNRNSINENPEYQRESAVWSKEKQQLFIDSILNKFDVPKIYFHDIRSEKGLKHYAVVDGKQRLHAIYSFLQDEFPLHPDFTVLEARAGQDAPAKGSKFSDLSEYWKEEFKGTSLSVVLIQNANDEDIEELFSRLNNGEPLNAAEKRNAKNGEMCKLIRDIAREDDFFIKKIKTTNKRYQHYEIAAKFLLLERTAQNGGGQFADLKKRFLDDLVERNKSMTSADSTGLKRRVIDQLKTVSRVFTEKDPLLSKQAYPPLYYIFIKRITSDYADAKLYTKLRKFIANFHAERAKNLELSEEDRDSVLIEFGRLMQQGTNDLNSLRERTAILIRYFLLENPEIQVRDKKRAFSDEERLAIWILGGRKCGECDIEITIDDMHADHCIQWSNGGSTSLNNARCLCQACNTSLAKKTK
ncbi:DUF262 domain-containing protein [Pseudomonas putida]|uniref:DUF262 domain-containing protein n=1 Tax=Pseudomonas putida TaxID=303 RepID=A0A2Z4RTL4_PSEPU|nr:DUF262 domain-containing protein [Pseudomonas putida]AWY43628.1 DUF262 domain-containing protein [Pseudomonas putida]